LAVNVSDWFCVQTLRARGSAASGCAVSDRFLELIREFYAKARISQHWSEVRREYDRAIVRVAPAVRETTVRTDAYMRLPLGGCSQPQHGHLSGIGRADQQRQRAEQSGSNCAWTPSMC
jgi:hypothetical protein